MKETGSHIIKAAFIIFLLIAVGSGCSEKIIGPPQKTVVTVEINAGTFSPKMATSIDRFELTVEGWDFSLPNVPMTWQGDAVVASVEVPVGGDRRFIAVALSKDGIALYRGEITANVTSRLTTRLTINMLPMVPMINITPHYQSSLMNSPVSFDINVFNIPELSQIYFEVVWNDAPCYVDTIVRGDDLVATALLGYTYSYLSAAVTVTNGNQAFTITSPAGHAHLATVTFGTHSDWSADTATVVMQLLPRGAYLTSGRPFPFDSIYTDDGRIFLVRPVIIPE